MHSKINQKRWETKIDEYLDAVLEAVELPACIADLDPSLADVDRDALSHLRILSKKISKKIENAEEGRAGVCEDAFQKWPCFVLLRSYL